MQLVDLRAHILWGLDEGPVDVDQSLAMLRVAAEHGTTDIVATPRVSFERPFDPEIIAQRLRELRARYDGSEHIHTGCDFYFGFTNIRAALHNPRKYTINRQKYLMLRGA